MRLAAVLLQQRGAAGHRCGHGSRARLRRGLFPHRLRRGGRNGNRSGWLLANGLRRGRRRDFRLGDFRQIKIQIEIVECKLEIIIVEAGEIREIQLFCGCRRRSSGNRRGLDRRGGNHGRLHLRSLRSGNILHERCFAATGNGIFRDVVNQLVHRRQMFRFRLLGNLKRHRLCGRREGLGDRRRKGRSGLHCLNDGRRGIDFDLRLDAGCGRLLLGAGLNPPRIDSRNIPARAEIGERQPQAGKFQRGPAAMRRRTHGNRCGRLLGDSYFHLVGEIESLRLRRIGMTIGVNVARNIGGKLRHRMPFGRGGFRCLRLFPPSLLGDGLVNHRLGGTRLARMHIENFRHRGGVVAEIRTNILRGRFDVVVNIGLIDFRKRLFHHLRCGCGNRRGFIRRRKLGLAAGENLLDTLHEIVGMDACANIVCRIKNDRIGMRRIVDFELPQKLVLEIKFRFAAGRRRSGARRSLGTRMRRTIFEADDTRQFCQRIVVSEPFGPGVPVIRDFFFDHYVFHHLRIAALASVL